MAVDVKALASKRVLGVPVLYLAAGGVAVLAIYAWRLKPASESPTDGSTDVSSVDGADVVASDVLPTLPQGTVVASSTGASGSGASNSGIETNSDWLRKGVAYLISLGKNPGDSQVALQTYLSGSSLSYTQGQMRDYVVKEYGIPPEDFIAGNTSAPVATKTNTPTPAPTNTAAATKTATPAVRRYTVVSGDSLSKIASRYGTTWQAIYNANRSQIRDPNLIYPGQVFVIP